MTLLGVYILAFVMGVGFITTASLLLKASGRAKLVANFRNNFRIGMKQLNEQNEVLFKTMDDLLTDVDEVSQILGGMGEVTYQPPFKNYIIHGYEVVLNIVSEMRTNTVHPNELINVDSILTRYLSTIKKFIMKIIKELSNPIKWFVNGVDQIVEWPVDIISSLGLIGDELAVKIVNSKAFKFINNLVKIATLVDSVSLIISQNTVVFASIVNIFRDTVR